MSKTVTYRCDYCDLERTQDASYRGYSEHFPLFYNYLFGHICEACAWKARNLMVAALENEKPNAVE